MEDNKNMNNGTVNETTDKKETENTAPAEEKVSVFKKIGGGIKKNWKKVLIPVTLVAGMAAGVAADRAGLPFGKKAADDGETTEE